ncbi:hypothetical protein DL765_002504 [Monosporascus sp. GIB2]|nr:hypothetical protein DL765_002504 [Monosporascus sp. GIB2]
MVALPRTRTSMHVDNECEDAQSDDRDDDAPERGEEIAGADTGATQQWRRDIRRASSSGSPAAAASPEPASTPTMLWTPPCTDLKIHNYKFDRDS